MKAPINAKSGNDEKLYIVPILGRQGYIFVWAKSAAEARAKATVVELEG